jgi:hypothetical protein
VARLSGPVMLIQAGTITGQMPMRWLVASGVLFASAFVLANDNARLTISPTYGEMLSDDIYERAEGWREQPMFESEWRAPKPEPKSRIKFGYDSAYEEVRAREDAKYSSRPMDLRDRPPAAQFRFSF